MLGRFVSFCMIGGVGFLVDGGILQVLFVAGANPVLARFISFPSAVAVTWFLNRRFTFVSREPTSAAYVKYFAGQSVGALINLGTYVLALQLLPALRSYPVVALAIGTAPALCFNFLWSQLVVFRRQEG